MVWVAAAEDSEHHVQSEAAVVMEYYGVAVRTVVDAAVAGAVVAAVATVPAVEKLVASIDVSGLASMSVVSACAVVLENGGCTGTAGVD